MPVRGPGQGPRGTGAGMRGQMGRGDYGKYQPAVIFTAIVYISRPVRDTRHTCVHIYMYIFVCHILILFRRPFNDKKRYIRCTLPCMYTVFHFQPAPFYILHVIFRLRPQLQFIETFHSANGCIKSLTIVVYQVMRSVHTSLMRYASIEIQTQTRRSSKKL